MQISVEYYKDPNITSRDSHEVGMDEIGLNGQTFSHPIDISEAFNDSFTNITNE